MGTAWGLVLSVVILLGGGIWFTALPEVGNTAIPRSSHRFGAVLGTPSVLLATTVGFVLIGTISAMEAGVVATFSLASMNAGIILASIALASLVSGLAVGHAPIGPWALARRMFIVFLGIALASAGSNNFWWLLGTLMVAGVGMAPALSILFAIVSEAHGWVGTGQLIGGALGSSLAGFVIDSNGPVGAFWVAGAFAAVGLAVPVFGRAWHPDLRIRPVSPIADTESLPATPT